MLVSKSNLTQDSWFYSYLGHHSAGGISRCLVRHLLQVLACYPFPTINFLLLYRDLTMTEFEFFANREERWSDSMRALWGSLSICPLLDYVDLPYHMAGELLSISHLKVWGDSQKPQHGMAYLLVRVEDASEVKGYGIALVWISPLQARASTMEEALEILSICISSGPNWPYVLTQLYEGTNHAPLPKAGTSVSCPRERWRAHVGRSVNLKSTSSYLLDHKSSIQWV